MSNNTKERAASQAQTKPAKSAKAPVTNPITNPVTTGTGADGAARCVVRGNAPTGAVKSGLPGKRAVKMLTNCTGVPRGIALGEERLVLGPLEMRTLTDAQYDALKKLFVSRTFQRFADTGVFRLSGMSPDEQPLEMKTPEPPAALTAPVLVGELGAAVGTSTGSRATGPRTAGRVVVE